jgi:hypothetical protein
MDLWGRQKADSQLIDALIAHLLVPLPITGNASNRALGGMRPPFVSAVSKTRILLTMLGPAIQACPLL